jgi:hypothetical protein
MTPQPRGRTRSVTLPRARTPRQIVPSFSRSRTAPIACSGIACVFFHIFLSFQNAPDVVLPGRAPEASHFFCGLAGSTFADWLLIRALYERSVERNLKFSRYLTWGIVRGRFFPWGIFSQCGYGVHTICQALPKWSCRCSFISSSVDRVLQWPCFATPTLLHQQHAFYFM